MGDIIELAKERFASCLSAGKTMRVTLDRDANVLHVAFVNMEHPEVADCTERRGDYILRLKGSDFVGVTVLNAASHAFESFRDLVLEPRQPPRSFRLDDYPPHNEMWITTRKRLKAQGLFKTPTGRPR